MVVYEVSYSAVDFFYDLEMLVLQTRAASEENILEVYQTIAEEPVKILEVLDPL